MLIYVTTQEVIDSKVFLVAEPLITTTGIENDEAEWEGELFILDDNTTKSIGVRHVLLSLMNEVGLRWQISGDSLPAPPFFLTSDKSQVALFDGGINLDPSDLLMCRIGESVWNALAVKVVKVFWWK